MAVKNTGKGVGGVNPNITEVIDEEEYRDLRQSSAYEERDVGELKYLDFYSGEEKNESALTARVIAGEGPYHITVTYHSLHDGRPEPETLGPVMDIVGEEKIEELLE